MVRTLKRMTRKIRRSKGGGTKRRLRGGADVEAILKTDVDGAVISNGFRKFKEFFTAKPSVLETVASATGATAGGSRRRRRRNKTKKH